MCLADYIRAHLSLGRAESQSQTPVLAAKRPAAVRTRRCLVHFWGRKVSVMTVLPLFFSSLPRFTSSEAWAYLWCPVLKHAWGNAGLWLSSARHLIKYSYIQYGFISRGGVWCFLNVIWILITLFDSVPQSEAGLGKNAKDTPLPESRWTEAGFLVFGKLPYYDSVCKRASGGRWSIPGAIDIFDVAV